MTRLNGFLTWLFMQSQGLTSKLRRPTLKKSNSVKETFLQSCRVSCRLSCIANVFIHYYVISIKHLCSKTLQHCIDTLKYKKQQQKLFNLCWLLVQKHDMYDRCHFPISQRTLSCHQPYLSHHPGLPSVATRRKKPLLCSAKYCLSDGINIERKKHDYISILWYKEH